MHHFVYKTTCKVNGKIYIGKHSTDDLNDGYLGSGNIISEAIKKYGIDQFEREILFECTSSLEALEKEKEVVTWDLIKTGTTYNLIPGGYGPPFGGTLNKVIVWDENGNRFIVSKEEYRDRDDLKVFWEGRSHSESTRKTISEKRKELFSEGKIQKLEGELNPMFGKTHSEEIKQKFSETLKERWKDPAFQEKALSNLLPGGWNKGIPRTEESNKKTSESMKGKNIGPHSEESKAKMSQIKKERNRQKRMRVLLEEINK